MQLQPKPRNEKSLTDRIAYRLGEMLGFLMALIFVLLLIGFAALMINFLFEVAGGFLR